MGQMHGKAGKVMDGCPVRSFAKQRDWSDWLEKNFGSSSGRYAVLFRIQTAKKAETRARKIREFVEMLERKETIHPARKAAKNRGAAKG